MPQRYHTIFFLCLLLVLAVGPKQAFAQPDAVGELMFVGFNADGTDGISFVTLVEIPDAATIFFNENEWNGSAIGAGGAFNTGEGTLTWENNTGGAIAVGTVVTITNLSSGTTTATTGSASRSGSFNLNVTNEVVYAYVGTDVSTPTAFLSALASDDFGSGSIDNTGLTEGTTAIRMDALEADIDVAVYQGSTTCNTTVADCAQMIATVNGTNWSVQGGSGDQDQDATAPDFPDDVTGNFSGSALPVELVTFEGFLSGETIRLFWETASETNNAGFEVQLQVGDTFAGLTFVDGAGTTTEAQAYSHTIEDLQPGVHVFRLKQVDFDGRFEYSPAIEVAIGLPEAFRLSEAYPNPFNPQAQFSLTVGVQQEVRVAVFDMMGREVAVLFQGTMEANQTRALVFDAGNLPSGQYMYRVVGETFKSSRTVTLLK